MKLHYLPLVLTLLLFACSSNKQTDNVQTGDASIPTVSVIEQPMKNVAPARQLFTFDNSKGMVRKTSRQSLISVPEDAFVLEDGTPIKGELSIEFQEIFNPAEIILAGIPMNVEHNGEFTPFISDGMFSITASYKGKEAKLAEGKTIAVGTSSEKKNTDFDYWYYNEDEGKWENLGDRTATVTEDKVMQRSTEINPVQTGNFIRADQSIASETTGTKSSKVNPLKKPAPPASHNPGDFVFNISASYSDYPELAPYKNVLWKPLLKMNADEQKVLKTGMQTFGANVNLECKDKDLQVYEIHYGSRTVEATPVYIGSDKKKAQAVYAAKMESYAKKLKEEEDAKKIAQKTADQYAKTYNLFAVNKMGIYNCDRFMSTPPAEKNNYTFRCDEKPVEQNVFAVLKDNQGVIALFSGYKQGDYYSLPGSKISGFIYTDPLGVVSYSKNEAPRAEKANEIDLLTYRKPVDKPEELLKLIQSF